MELFIAVLASLFSVVNPIGALPVYTSMTSSHSIKDRRRTALHTTIYFTMICLIFFLGGSYILSFFGISIPALRLAGGLVILNSGFSLLNGKVIRAEAINEKMKEEARQKEDISFSPLAMPLLSGPGSISLLISLYALHPDWNEKGIIIGVMFALGLIIYIMLLSAPLIARVLGEAGMKAVTRIMGFIVMAIACEYIVGGAMSLISKH